MTGQGDLRATAGRKTGFFYGYVFVIAAFVIMTLTFGINASFGVFLGPLSADFGWTRAATSAAYSISTILAGTWGIIAGRVSDRPGPKMITIFGGVCLGVGFLLMSRATALWQFYLYYGVIIAAGVGGCYPVLLATAAKWFVARRGLVTGIISAGLGCGAMLTPPISSWIIASYDWRLAYLTVGIGTMVLIVVASLFLKRDPYQVGLLPYGLKEREPAGPAPGYNFRRALRTRQFWMICATFFLFGYCSHTVTVHIVAHATGMGISPTTAASILVVIGGTSIVFRLMAGVASDRFGVRLNLTLSLVMLLVALIWVQMTDRMWGLSLFGVAFGVANGGAITVQALLLAELFGLRALGTIVGVSTFAYTVGGSLGPFVAGHIFDVTGGYHAAFIICTVLATAAIGLTLLIRPIAKAPEVAVAARAR